MRNVEIKAKIRNIVALLEKVKELCKDEGTIIHQHDTFYKVPSGRLKLRKFEDESGELIYYERPDVEGPKLCSFDKCEFDKNALSGLNRVLTRGLGIKGIVKKKRHLFLIGQTRVHIDYVENLGEFLELEVCLNDDESEEKGQSTAQQLLKKLGVADSDLLSTAYTDLLQQTT